MLAHRAPDGANKYHCSGVAVLCLHMTYFWPLVIKSLEGASAVSLGAHLLRRCDRVFFDKKVAWPQSPGSGSADTGTMIYHIVMGAPYMSKRSSFDF